MTDSDSDTDTDTDTERLNITYDAVLFELDGIVADTDSIHGTAWRELFESVLSDPRLTIATDAFTAEAEAREWSVDGRSRGDTLLAFLSARHITLPIGTPNDFPSSWTIHGLLARQDELCLRAIGENGVGTYPGTIALLHRLRDGHVPVGLVSSNRDARELLKAAGIEDLFDVVVDGTFSLDSQVQSTPDTTVLVEAARQLGVTPRATAVVAKSLGGVAAAKEGCFGLVVGIDRSEHRERLKRAGADRVLTDVGELDLGASRSNPWLLIFNDFDPGHEGHREALTTLGNGYQATRGARPEHNAVGVHYPGTYLAGVYNRVVRTVRDTRMEEEHLVNAPNWLPIDVRIGTGSWWSTDGAMISAESHELDLRRGLLTRHLTLTGSEGQRLTVVQRRLVSMDDPHIAALETTITPDGWSGQISVRSSVQGAVSNTNVLGYQGPSGQHLTAPHFEDSDTDTALTTVSTLQSHVRIALAVRTELCGQASLSSDTTHITARRSTRQFIIGVHDGHPVVVTKTAATYTSKDPASSSPEQSALAALTRSQGGFAGLRDAHQSAWRRLWERFAVAIDADPHSQLVLNLHMFHLLQTLSPHTIGMDVGVPARGLHGEGYRGHVFWDELFVLPGITLRRPDVSAALLDYRWRRLDAARDGARSAGWEGVRFPWQSGSDGREETPTRLFNTRSGRWMPDNSRRQVHVGLAVAYNAWQHFQITGDRDWLSARGAELIIEVTRMFASLAEYDPVDDRYHLSGVMGPDEYHDGYPDSPGTGIRDNAYTNVLFSWVCERAVEALSVLAGHSCDDLSDRLRIRPEEISRWTQLSRRMFVPFHGDGVLSQFDGYDELKELDWGRYRARYGNIGRLDLILEAENDATNRYKLSKQPDVLMLVYLLGPDDTLHRLGRLGYPTTDAELSRTVEYYLSRTAHGSTLSRVVEASVLAHIDVSRAWAAYGESLVADLDDTQGGTTREGIHLGAMAGTSDLAVRAFAGLHAEADTLTFTPRLPPHVQRLAFQINYRGQRIDISLTGTRLRLHLHPCGAAPVNVGVNGRFLVLTGGDIREFPTDPGAPVTAYPRPDWSSGESEGRS